MSVKQMSAGDMPTTTSGPGGDAIRWFVWSNGTYGVMDDDVRWVKVMRLHAVVVKKLAVLRLSLFASTHALIVRNIRRRCYHLGESRALRLP